MVQGSGHTVQVLPDGIRMSDLSNVIVFAAVIAVAIVLLLGLVNMLRGGSANRSQQLMRLRVLLQFVAIVIIMGIIWWRAA